MPDVVIEHPIINPPFEEPKRHYKFARNGITEEIVHKRRPSSYFMPIATSRKKSKQLVLDTEWTDDRVEKNENINRIRERVGLWRKGGYAGITPTTRRLLEYWTNPDRDKPLFFCQIEALETAIYLNECAAKYGDGWIENFLREQNECFNNSLPRMAFKMATGSGKTVVMAMLIAWQVLNKATSPQDARFTESFLIVCPGITIRDRLRVLMPNDSGSYYRERDLIPGDSVQQLGGAKIVITNFHSFLQRNKVDLAKNTRIALAVKDDDPAFKETPDDMARRICQGLGKTEVMVINDEAHHCYQRAPDKDAVSELKGDDKKEAEERNKEALVWLRGLLAVKKRLGIKRVLDLSATPFFLNGSGWEVNKLFPWTVSDFSLVDAIESGIVKIPRVPVKDNAVDAEEVTYRDIWSRIREDLPRKGRKTEKLGGKPELPVVLQGAIHSLYDNYKKDFEAWDKDEDAKKRGRTPPVFIIVCNNTNVSKLVYEYVSGWEKTVNDQIVLAPGALPIFSNVKDGAWLHRPNSVLVDSSQLESGEAISKDFKQIAAREIEAFKHDYRLRYPGRDIEKLTDEDLLREVMNTVGKSGKLGEQVKCVVSVSMLTEGWDANTVTHILGIRAFGTQLLCEQVVGRGLRRMSYATMTHEVTVGNEEFKFEAFAPEYAEVYGVPFSFIPTTGTGPPPPIREITRVRALESRAHLEIRFPRLVGYKVDLPDERLGAKFNSDARMSLSAADVPTITTVAPILGETEIHTLDDLRSRRGNEVAFLLAKHVMEKYFVDDDSNAKPWLFPDVLAITKKWIDECLIFKDDTFLQMLLLHSFAHDAADKIYRGIANSQEGTEVIKPILRPYDTTGSTKYVDFDTTKPVYETDPNRCHISHVVADTNSWEQKLAQSLEDMDEVVAYAKNHGLNFTIFYTIDGDARDYHPDFIVQIRGDGEEVLNLLIEVTGQKKKDKAAKVSTTRSLWIPAVNNHGGFGRWAFLECTDPWDAKNLIRAFLAKGAAV
ncbi:MAG: DEAD/DEAH box helicase family protein [Armatimonadetes bacterium]|nr:DEAD/DEAH box helicase family protein [Armatimonadota bacterium]